MEFHEKLQELRKNKGLTQEELAESLYTFLQTENRWYNTGSLPFSTDGGSSISESFIFGCYHRDDCIGYFEPCFA